MIVYPKIKAACLPYYPIGNKEILMLYMRPSNPKYGGTYFQLAKGCVDPEESIEETAKREALEEVGLTEDNIKNWFFVDAAEIKDYIVFLYAAEVKDPNLLVDPGYETGKVQWIGVDEILSIVRKCQHRLIYKAIKRITDVI